LSLRPSFFTFLDSAGVGRDQEVKEVMEVKRSCYHRLTMAEDNKSASELSPLPAFRFHVEISGMTFPFRSCQGLKIEQQVIDLEEGGFNTTTRKLVGKVKYPNIVLKQGMCPANSELYKLKQRFLNDTGTSTTTAEPGRWKTPNRFDGVITQIGADGHEVKWFFSGATIVKWEGPALDASKNEISIEAIEIAHNGLVMVGGAGPQFKNEPQPPPPAEKQKVSINFGNGSADPGSNAAVQGLADDLKNNPDKRVRVEGHTDNVGSAASNQTLSQQRADAVRNQLISGGAQPSQVTAIGFGEDQPIADNNTAAGRAQNRRVDVIEQ
jgi:phage tail-like protein